MAWSKGRALCVVALIGGAILDGTASGADGAGRR